MVGISSNYHSHNAEPEVGAKAEPTKYVPRQVRNLVRQAPSAAEMERVGAQPLAAQASAGTEGGEGRRWYEVRAGAGAQPSAQGRDRNEVAGGDVPGKPPRGLGRGAAADDEGDAARLSALTREARAEVAARDQQLESALSEWTGEARQAQRPDVDRLVEILDQRDAARGRLLKTPGLSEVDRQTLAKQFGVPNPLIARGAESLSSGQKAAIGRMAELFQAGELLHLKPGTLAPGVKPASPGVLAAMTELVRLPYASVDGKDAPNIDHLAAVAKGVFEDEERRLQRPLKQGEADQRFAETMCTDLLMKNVPREVLLANRTPTALTNRGDNMVDVDPHMVEQGKANFDRHRGGDLTPRAQALAHRWIDEAFVPMDPKDVEERAQAQGLSPEEAKQLAVAVKERIIDTGEWVNIQGFMRGILTHNLPPFEPIRCAVESAPGGLNVQHAYESALGHAGNSFVLAGIDRAKIMPEFDEIERREQIEPGAGKRLKDLWERGTALYGTWRPKIEKAVGKSGGGMEAPERAQFARASAGLADALRASSRQVELQAVNDERAQFRSGDAQAKGIAAQAITKWLENEKRPTQGATIASVATRVQAYYEQEMARQADPRPFVAATARSARRLGFTHDAATRTYRPAGSEDDEYATFARALAANAQVRKAFRAYRQETGAPMPSAPTAKAFLERAGAEDLVEWFRAQPFDRDLLVQIVEGEKRR